MNLSRGLYYRYKFYKEFLKNGLNYKGDSYFADEILKEIKSGNYVDIGCYPFFDSQKDFGVNIELSSKNKPSVFLRMFLLVIATILFISYCFAQFIADDINLLHPFLVIWRIAIAASSFNSTSTPL